MKYPNIIYVHEVLNRNVNTQLANGRWVVARPLGFASPLHRIKAAWLVFTGRADALKWDGGQ